MKLRYDLLDDIEIEDTQTSSSELIPSDGRPVDEFEHVLSVTVEDDNKAEEMKERLEMICQSCLNEFSEIETDEEGSVSFRVGFDNSFLNPKSAHRFLSAINNLPDTEFNIDDEEIVCEDLTDSYMDWNGMKTKFAYKMFPFDKFGFKLFDIFVNESEEARLEAIADFSYTTLFKKHNGTLDLSFIMDEDEFRTDFHIRCFHYSDVDVQDIEEDVIIGKDSNYILRPDLSKIENPSYQFGYDDFDAFYFQFTLLLGQVYLKDANNVVDLALVIYLNEYDSVEESDGFNLTYPEFMDNLNRVFGGRMPDELRKHIDSEINKREMNR